MIFHTNYNHIFAVYFKNTLCWNEEGEVLQSAPKDEKSGLFVLRTQHKYGNYECPRIINIKPSRVYESKEMLHSFTSFFGRKAIHFMGIHIRESPYDQQYKHQLKIGWRTESIGNEICGGSQFDDTKREYCGRDLNHEFSLRDVEVYTIL